MAAPKDYTSYLKNKCIVGYGIVNGIIALVVATPIAWICTFVLPLPLSHTGMMIFKGVMCAIAGCVSGYVVIGATTAGFEREAAQTA